MMIIFTRFWRYWVIVLVILQTAGCWVGDQKYASVDLPEDVQVAVISPAPH